VHPLHHRKLVSRTNTDIPLITLTCPVMEVRFIGTILLTRNTNN